MMRPIIYTILWAMFLAFPTLLFCQSWELGIGIDATNYQGDLVKSRLFTPSETKFGGTLFLRRRFNQHFALRANVVAGRITGNDNNFTDRVNRGFSFKSPIYEGAIMGEYSPLSLSKKDGTKRMLLPYFFIGGGYVSSKAVPDFGKSRGPILLANAAKDKANIKNSSFCIPFGAGFMHPINDRIHIEMEIGFRPTFSDYLDGISEAGNPSNKDTYVVGGLNVVFHLGESAMKDKDGDGISDKKDKCPDKPGDLANDGCPADRDKDGISDNIDKCPDLAGIAINAGCPNDRDKDGIYDADDLCPDKAGDAANKGCPTDRDQDGIADADDKCPDLVGTATNRGCPNDRDNDGIYDADDKCPDVAGKNSGCPEPPADRDKDGIADADDRCPDLVGTAANLGCPNDSDKDGVYDADDRCPTIAGDVANKGCPAMKESVKKALNTAIQNINFKTGSAILTNDSYQILDQVATALKEYGQYNVAIEGHTDNAGESKSNLALSKNRSKACYDYLLKKEIPAARMSHNGYGESKPLTTNNTEAGRLKNRRVEFNLSL